ncbi:MAG: hypothetical protein WA810_05265 [Maribacter sp.]
MKKLLIYACFGVALTAPMHGLQAQEDAKPELKVQERTLMEKFEADYVLPVLERQALKENRITHQRNTKKILDTLDISDRKRRLLMKELRRDPFSLKIKESIMAETQFEDDPDY